MLATTSKTRMIFLAFVVMAMAQGVVIYLATTAPPTTVQFILVGACVIAVTMVLIFAARREAAGIIEGARSLREREPMGDEEFICACGSNADPALHRVALAVRRVLAEQGRAISSEKIRPDDSLSHTMWEGSSWETICFLVQRKGALELAEGTYRPQSDSLVRDLVQALAAGAKPLSSRELLESFGNAGDPYCVECGYNLRGLPASSLCPECGADTRRARWLNVSRSCGYDISALIFLVNGTRWTRESRPDLAPPGHMHARELCHGLAAYALKKSGTPGQARDLLSRLNLCNPEQVGALVYILIAYKFFQASGSDIIEDFDGLGDLTTMFQPHSASPAA